MTATGPAGRAGGKAALPMLARLARRYAGRHRAQTVRAVLGLMVISLILMVGLGLGDSLQASLERSVEGRFGPVDVVVRGPPLFNETLVQDLEAVASAAAHGPGDTVSGVPTLAVLGSVSNPSSGRAEGIASIRGVHPDEGGVLGAFPGGAPEPGPGETVLSTTLAGRLNATVGDRLVLRVLPQDLNATFGFQTRRVTGVAPENGTGNGTDALTRSATATYAVEPGVLGLLVEVVLRPAAGDAGNGTASVAGATVTLQAPGGSVHPFQQRLDVGAPEEASYQARVLGQVEVGNWTLKVTAPTPDGRVAYEATFRSAKAPPDLQDLVTVLNVTVVGIAPTEGRAAIAPRPNALVFLPDLQAALDAEGQASHGYYHVTGDAQRVEARLEEHLGNATWRVDAVKADAVARIRTDAGQVTGFIIVMGGFTIVASLLLAYVLFSSLVEERRVELGIARALGLSRGEVAIAMLLEALLYAVLAAVAGVALGLGALLALVPVANAYSAQYNGPAFFLELEPWSVPVAVAAGTLLPLVTIAIGTLRFTRLDPSRAIRGAPDDLRIHRRLVDVAGWVFIAGGLALLMTQLGWLVGPGLACGGAALLLASSRRRLMAAAVAAGGIGFTAWTLYEYEEFPASSREMDPVLTMLRALVIALLLVTLAMASPRPYRLAGRLAGRFVALRRAAFVAFRHLAARRVQAGLTAAMLAVVAVVVTVMGSLAAIFAGSLVTEEGGYDIVGQSPFPLTTFPSALAPADTAAVVRAEFVAVHTPIGGGRLRFDGEPFREGRFVRFAGVTPGFAASNEYSLSDRAAAYPSDRAAWDAVAAGDAVLAPAWYFGSGDLDVGGTLQVDGASGRSYVVAGAIANARRGDFYLAHDHVRSMGFPQSATVFVRVADGTDAAALAHRLTEAYQAEGLVFESVAEEAQEAADILRASTLIVQSFLFLGVFVGISATGFLATRAVHERIKEIGTLRAIGHEPKDVSRAFVVEAVLVGAVGLLIGTLVGLLVAHSIWWRSVQQGAAAFAIPWEALAVFWVSVLGLTAIASWAPTRRAARLDPAVALRHVE